MEETLESLEKKRKELYHKLEALGDFRRGTISVNYRKCGKKKCICAKPGHPGHGPQYLWNTTIKGKSYAKNLRLGPELEKYMKETGNYRKFLNLSAELVQVSERICELRPVQETQDRRESEELKKKIIRDLQEEIQKEVDRIVMVSYRDKEKVGHIDLESLEIHIRSAMHGVGSVMLEKLINADGGDYRKRTLPCEHGHVYEFKEYRDKEVLTVLGWVAIRRAYYYDPECEQGYCPKDRDLDIEETTFSPGVRRMMGKVGAHHPFGVGLEDLKDLAGVEVNSKAIERVSYKLGEAVEAFHQREGKGIVSGKVVPLVIKPIPKMYIGMDGTGVPVVKAETVGRRGKGEQGEGKTRDAKLGCVFTQTVVNEKGFPVRDEDSTSYVGAIEGPDTFGNRLYAEALRRGLEKAQQVCVLGDGAPWIWNLAEEHFYGAIQIIDLYHAREHYWNAARCVFGAEGRTLSQWAEARRKELDRGKVEQVIEAIGNLCPSTETQEKILKTESAYFEKNMERMRYAEFRRQGLFVGSGVVEAGCRTVIGQRLKQSGMHWTVKGANRIIALRCCVFSGRWEDFWEYRASG